MKSQKYYERDKFSYDEKRAICNKSDGVCCHCGKPAFIGSHKYVDRVATIDHFIPLNRGGSNQSINLVMMCEDCNKEKGQKIYDISYVPYLKDEFKKPLADYVNSYIQVMDCTRQHLLAYDKYEMHIPSFFFDGHKRKGGDVKTIAIPYDIVRLDYNNFDEIVEFLTKYLKKYDALDDADTVRNNVTFWLMFGTIYGARKRSDGTLCVLFALTVKTFHGFEAYRACTCMPQMFVFPLYSSDTYYYITHEMIGVVGFAMIEEKHLPYMPITLLMLKNDKLVPKLISVYSVPHDSEISDVVAFEYKVGGAPDIRDDINVNDEDYKLGEYLASFGDISKKMLNFFSKYNNDTIGWMILTVFSLKLIMENPDFQGLRQFLKEENYNDIQNRY